MPAYIHFLKHIFTFYCLAEAYKLVGLLDLHIPSSTLDRNVQSKYTIVTSQPKPFAKKPYKRVIRFYQCQCGVDHAFGRHVAKKRQVPWADVGCLSWIRLITLHDKSNGV